MVFEARRFHWTLGLGMNLNIRHNFSSSFPFSASSLKSNSEKRERRKKIERHTKEVKLFYFSFCCLYSPFLFRICVHIVSARLCFPSQPTNGANRNYYALYTVFKRGTKPSHSIFLPFCVYRNVVSNLQWELRTNKSGLFLFFSSVPSKTNNWWIWWESENTWSTWFVINANGRKIVKLVKTSRMRKKWIEEIIMKERNTNASQRYNNSSSRSKWANALFSFFSSIESGHGKFE